MTLKSLFIRKFASKFIIPKDKESDKSYFAVRKKNYIDSSCSSSTSQCVNPISRDVSSGNAL